MLYSPAFTFSSVYPLVFLPCAGLRLWAVRQFQVFFASSAPPPWHTAFSRFVPVVNSAVSVLASGSNFAVKPTHLRRAAYFRSLACEKPALFRPMFYSPAFTFSSIYPLGFCRVPGFAFWRCASFKLFWHLAPALLALAASVFVAFLVWPLCG